MRHPIGKGTELLASLDLWGVVWINWTNFARMGHNMDKWDDPSNNGAMMKLSSNSSHAWTSGAWLGLAGRSLVELTLD